MFVGGYADGVGSTLDGQYSRPTAIDSNITIGEQEDVVVQYLTIQKFTPFVDQTAINQTGNRGWKLLNSTVTLNVPGGGIFAASDAVLRDNCLTLNGQYGFQSAQTIQGDSLTGGPYNVWVERNEISYNDTCGLSGLLQNPALGWHDHNPVPPEYRNPHCGDVTGSGNQGGFKLWGTNGVMIRDNWIHHNWGVGGWVDSNNANTTWTGNTITDNENGAIWEETSYNFSITDNHLARNNLVDGPDNAHFPMPAIYVSESGSDSKNGGVPACTMKSCLASGMPGYPDGSVIANNTLVDNGGGVFLWQNSNRYCNDGFDSSCTLLEGRPTGTVQPRRLRREPPGGHPGPLHVRRRGDGVPARELLGRLHVGDAERHGDPQPHRLQPLEHLRLHRRGLAGLRGERRVQPVRWAERPGRRGRHPDPDHLLPEQPMVRERLPGPFDVLRLEPGQPAQPRRLGRLDRVRRRW